MIQKLAALILALAILHGCDATPDATVGTDVTVLTGARVIDGTGSPPLENATLVIQGERLESVGPADDVTIPEGATVIDVTGKTIMPPMISIHMHLAMGDLEGLDNLVANFTEANIQANLEQYARYGVLHVTSQGTDKLLIDDVRERQRVGDFPGALVYSSGRGFGVEGGYPPIQPDASAEMDVYRPTSVDEVPGAVEELAARDVAFVKLWVDHHFETLPPFSPEISQAILDEAQSHGLRTVAHIHTLEDAHRMVDQGVDGLVHSVRDYPVDQELIDAMTANDVFAVATLAREESMFIYAGRAPYLDDPFFARHVPASALETLASEEFQEGHLNNPELEEWEPALRTAQENLRTLHDNGVKIGFGSDSGPPARFVGYFEHREMELMAEAGLTPGEIIQIATLNSAEILEIDSDYGSIEDGKMAEFLILDQNPLEDISNTKTLEQVWQRGARIH